MVILEELIEKEAGPVREISNNVVCATSKASDQSESTLVKMPHCWKSHATAQLFFFFVGGGGGQHKTKNKNN